MNHKMLPHRRAPGWNLLRALALGILSASAAGLHAQSTPGDDSAGEVEELVSLAGEDPNLILPSQPTQSVFGLGKSAVDTPRSYTVISSDLLDKLAIVNSEDIARIAPSTYSTFRFGLQGGVSVRGQTADFYFRGMRRIDPQGNYRTIFAANDSIEIVRGPPSPIYGLGRIGGYLNFNPKTARLSRTGKYLDSPTGQISYTTGSYGKNVVRVDVGGPLKVAKLSGGYQVFGYFEDSDSYYSISPHDRHKIIQATVTLDVTPNWRMESGGVYQKSKGGLPGGINRTYQGLIDDGLYWNGTFSYQMDLNGDGSISDYEMLDSYAGNNGFRQTLGHPSGSNTAFAGGNNTGFSVFYRGQQNDPMRRRIPWQGAPINGGTITVDQFRAGYTTTVRNASGSSVTVQRQGYQLMIYPLGPDGQRNLAATPTPLYMPYAFDPLLESWEQVPFDYRKSFGEDYYLADVGTLFVDFINDVNPELTFKSQFLLDYQSQEKTGRNPFSQFQNITTLEEKFTVTKKFNPNVSWFKSTFLASANVFAHNSNRVSDNGDYDHRRSLMVGFTPQDQFFAYTKGDRTMNTSAANRNDSSEYWNWGIGAVADTTWFNKLNVMAGGRYDRIGGKSWIDAGLYNRQTNGGVSVLDYANNSQGGTSWSINASYDLLPWLKPYYTYAIQAAPVLDGSTSAIPPSNLRNGPIASSLIKEAGFKVGAFEGRLFLAGAYYLQTRNNWDPTEGAGAIGSIESKGYELELRWVVNRKLSLLGGFNKGTMTDLAESATITTTARAVGFPDVVDSTGKVVMPAEAFGWGGIITVNVPAGAYEKYNQLAGRPEMVTNLTAIYQFTPKWTARLTGYYQGEFYTDQLRTYRAPSAVAFDGGVTWNPTDKWEVRFNVQNLLDKRYYSGGSFQSVSQRLPRTFELAVERSF